MNFIPLTIIAMLGLFGNLNNGEDSILKKEYFNNGNIKTEYILLNAKIVEAVYYYENGAVREKGFFKGQQMHGTWKSFNNTGLLIAEAKYENGVALKKTFWNNDGSIAGIISNNQDPKLVDARD